MSGDWVEDLSGEDRAQWDHFVESARREAFDKISASDIFLSLVPEEPDVKAAVEIGFAVLLDKPILSILMPGRKMPEHLRKISDLVVVADIDTEEGRETLSQSISDFTGREGWR